MVRKAIIAAALLAAPVPAIAQAPSITVGNGYYSQCNTPRSGSFDDAFCLGFIVGLSTVSSPTTAKNWEDFKSKKGQVYCIPTGTNNGQLYEIVTDYVRKTPRYRHMRMEYLYILALHDAYPCPQGATIRVISEPGVLIYDPPAP